MDEVLFEISDVLVVMAETLLAMPDVFSRDGRNVTGNA